MEVGFQEKSPQVSMPVEGNDAKYVSGLSTILVAHIQETKDRISQIEYIFCSQLYPNFQKSSKCFQRLYDEARRGAEEEWRERERQLQLQVKELCLGKEQALDECKSLKVDKSKLLIRVAELEEKLLRKTKEADDGMVLHQKLLDLIESKSSIVASKEKQMKEHEERMSFLLTKSEGLEGRISALNKELQEKNEEVTKGKELREELLRQIESQALKITCSEQMVIDTKMEKEQLAAELGKMEARYDTLRDELRKKTVEVEEGNKLREQLIRQSNFKDIELVKKDQQLSAQGREKKDKTEILDENLRRARSEFTKEIELKNAEILVEKQRNRDLTAAYKKLKSERNFLLSKAVLNKEDALPQVKVEGNSDPLNHCSKSLTPPEIKQRIPVSNGVADELNKVKKEVDTSESSDEEKSDRLNQSRSSHSPSSSNRPTTTPWIKSKNSSSATGKKRPASSWRGTRSRQSPCGPDPHDDFLDTPNENIRRNLQKASKENVQNIPAQVSRDMDCGSSDDETQDVEAESRYKKQQLQAPGPGPKGFKYVEPVRKKSERENLNGVECKQCKKFYDAVLPDAAGKNGEVDERSFRCEHLDGVSRHRYRYVPPSTPDGFWNIGFDTEN